MSVSSAGQVRVCLRSLVGRGSEGGGGNEQREGACTPVLEGIIVVLVRVVNRVGRHRRAPHSRAAACSGCRNGSQRGQGCLFRLQAESEGQQPVPQPRDRVRGSQTVKARAPAALRVPREAAQSAEPPSSRIFGFRFTAVVTTIEGPKGQHAKGNRHLILKTPSYM
jgi:hypothetical protein